MDFSVEVIERAGFSLVALSGDIDAYTAPQLTGRIDDALQRGITYLIIDLQHVSFIDSLGLWVLKSTAEAITKKRGKLALIAPQRHVRRLLSIIGLDKALFVCRTREQALNALDRAVPGTGIGKWIVDAYKAAWLRN